MGEIIAIAICLGLNAMLAAYEMAFVSFPKPELLRLAKQGIKDAKELLHKRENPERTLSIVQIGITLVGAVAAVIGGTSAAENIEPFLVNSFGLGKLTATVFSVLIVVIPLTYLNVVLGELVPKTLALRQPTKIVLSGARWLFIADKILSPVISILEWSTKTLIHCVFPKLKEPGLSQEAAGIELESLSPIHQRYVLNLASIENKLIQDLMLPWEYVNRIKHVDSMAGLSTLVFNSGHTRLPVVDEKENVVGLLHTKEFLAFRESGEQEWASLIRPLLRVRRGDSVLGALRLMQENKSHMAIVYSESGALLGIITLEDIIEEIVGDISDEDDDGRIRKLIASRKRMGINPS